MADRDAANAPALHAVSPDGPLYRIARAPDPWAWPDWANAGSDGTFGNRWDDVQGVYRVLYASSSRLGAFMEVLARFQPDLHVLAELSEIDSEGSEDVEAPGELDASWLSTRCIGVAAVHGEYVDVGHSDSLAAFRQALAGRVVHHALPDLDAATMRLSAPRRFTQEVSRYVYERTGPEGRRRYAGIAYRSRLGDEFQNWALFEPADGRTLWAEEPRALRLERDDPDLHRALELLGVRLVGG